ncbi:DUF4828 domain-containing protein [Liquorilactobacillus vini]|uniref:DUF4828 domain-containing protein n=1 Tax=Liquorilactobacillus vini TaxID=238015 RepID=UPI0003028AFE|nr:DUF4828 domain-containing protein [Liquorilactobacillus vini]
MVRSKSYNRGSSLRHLFRKSWIGQHLFNFHSPAASPTQYTGKWTFADKQTNRSHQLEITEQLQILIDGHRLPGKIVRVDDKELLFLDKYGYHLRVDANQRSPVSLYDEADNRVYPVSQANGPDRDDVKD